MIRPIDMTRLARAAAGELQGADIAISGIAIDSRSVTAGDLFAAIQGIRVDGHNFAAQALENGASAVLAERAITVPDGTVLQVDNTVRALGNLGQLLRDDYDGVLVGITGSAGKTTAKTMIAAVLAEAGNTLATEGNRNNEIGVPLTLARLQRDTEFAVIEMGAGKPNDIRYLCDIARPNVAVLLNAGTAHLDAYPDPAAIADTKGQIVDDLEADDLAVINADQTWTESWLRRAHPARCVTFGCDERADYRAADIEFRGFQGVSFVLVARGRERRVNVAIPGWSGVYNALAAAVVGGELGMSDEAVARGLSRVLPAAGRGRVERAPNGAVIADDTYNANPEAVKSAIDVLAQVADRKVLVLGSMRELGPGSAALHAEVGRYAAEHGIDIMITVGDEAKPASEAFAGDTLHFDTAADLATALPQFGAGDAVLVKGSRSVGLELVVTALLGLAEDVAC